MRRDGLSVSALAGPRRRPEARRRNACVANLQRAQATGAASCGGAACM